MKRIVFLVSGGGANLKFVNYALQKLNLKVSIVGILADRNISFIDFVENEKIYFKKIKYSRQNNNELLIELKNLRPDLIITNIHKIIDEETLSEHPNKFINLHYSILPAFKGLIGMKTIEEARKQNVQFIGGTCHEVNGEVDSGNILYQGLFAVGEWDLNSIELEMDTVFKLSCYLLLAGILKKLNLGKGDVNNLIINNKVIHFSPSLPLISTDFGYQIFNKLK